MINPLKIIKNGILTENPTFVLVLGMCPTIAVTTSAINGLGMGLAATAVLMGSNMAISAIRKCIPDEIRIPAFIVVIAGFVTDSYRSSSSTASSSRERRPTPIRTAS